MTESLPKISIITATYNGASTLKDTLESVANQTYGNIEHIVIDGLSTDNTTELVNSYSHVAKYISEKDTGMYHAINKGIKLSTGDYIGILNSDDIFSADDILDQVYKTFAENEIDALYGDVKYVSADLSRTVRYYSSAHFTTKKFKVGYMPAHPSYYAKKSVFDAYGLYKEDYKIAADFELLTRQLYSNKVKSKYLNLCMVNMRTGGMSNSSLKNRLIANKEMVRACRENGIKTNLLQMTRKVARKLSEYIISSDQK